MEINNWDDYIEYVPEDIIGADFDHYLLCEYWTLYEAGYLLNGINDEQDYPRKGSPMVKTQRLLERAALTGQLGAPIGDGYLPYKIIAYVIDKGRRVPDVLRLFYEEATPTEIEILKNDANKKITPKKVGASNWLDAEKPDLDDIYVFFRGFGDWWCCDGHPDDDTAQFHISGCYQASGIFRLSKKDKIIYKYTKKLDGISALFPCNHSDDEFSRVAGVGMLYIKEMEYRLGREDAESCYFCVDRSRPIFIQELLHARRPARRVVSNLTGIVSQPVMHLWAWLTETNMKKLTLVGGAIAALAIAGWTVYTYDEQTDKPVVTINLIDESNSFLNIGHYNKVKQSFTK